MKIAIIGAGLAGAALAYEFKKQSCDVAVYEKESAPAMGASGNDIGMYNPRLFANMVPEAYYHQEAFKLALETFQNHESIDWNPCGALHLITDEKRRKRYHKMVENWEWPAEDMRIVDQKEVQDIAGVQLQHDALYIRRSGYVSPKALTQSYLRDVDVRYNADVTQVHDLKSEADVVVLACAWGACAFEAAASIPLKTVRGQITQATSNAKTESLSCCLNYGGYTTPAIDGVHHCGATFQRWLTHTDLLPQDDEDNLSKLEAVLPGATDSMKIVHSRASLRTVSPDHFPVVGAIDKNIYISAAHGSHGIISSLMAAKIIANAILGEGDVMPQDVMQCLSPQRFA